MIANAIVGQHSDYVNFSDLFDLFVAYPCYCCGQPASWKGGIRPDGMTHTLCDGCHFRHTVMKAAGREEEFWKAAGETEYNRTVGAVTRERSYRMGTTLDAMVQATDASLSGK